MSHNHQLLHLELRHSADGLMSREAWESWHSAQHEQELDHTHSQDVAENGTGGGPTGQDRTNGQETAVRGPTASSRAKEGVPSGVRPAPTDAQKRAAWAHDIRNPKFVDWARGVTVIVDEQDFRE